MARNPVRFETAEQALRALLDTPLYSAAGCPPVTVGTYLPDHADAARALLDGPAAGGGAPAFDPAAVSIVRHRFSVTQGEVSVFYGSRLLDRFGDDIDVVKKGQELRPGQEAVGGYAGLPDAYWIEVARDRVKAGA